MRQVAPRTTGLLEVQERVHDLAQSDALGAARAGRVAFAQQRLQQGPLGIRQVARVGGAAGRDRRRYEARVGSHGTTRR